MCTSQKVIINYHDDDDKLTLSFRYNNGQFGERQFTFLRYKEEIIDNTFFRIKANILKAIDKKTRKRKKTNENEAVPELLETETLPLVLTVEAEQVDLNTKNIDAWKEGATFKIGDAEYLVSVNAPAVKSMALPNCILAGYLVYPRISLEFADLTQSLFTWFIIRSKKEFSAAGITNFDEMEKTPLGLYALKVGEGFSYQTSSDDTGVKLKLRCEPRREDQSGFVQEMVSVPIEAGPEKCPFEARQLYTQNVTNSGRFRCISYNILADLYADSDFTRTVLFPYCEHNALKLSYRIQLLLKEIFGYRGDLVCLQEVDTKVYKHDISMLLETYGLSGCFNEKGGQVAEGLACLFRKSKFRLIENHSHIIAELVDKDPTFDNVRSKVYENEKLKERLFARTTALQVVILESLEAENNLLLVGNTHLYFHPDSDHIRLLQAYVCVRYLEELAKQLEAAQGKCISVILSGDFNSCPEFGVYHLMTVGTISANCPDWSSNAEEAVPGGLNIRHNLGMDSACGQPAYTNYVANFNGCLDYIFYQTKALEVEEVVPMPSHEEVTEHTAIPSVKFPSDHLALVCTLRWKNNQ